MAYQVWTKDDFEGWKRKDCETLEAAQGEILLAIKGGKEPLLTEEVPFGVNIWIKGGQESEATPDKTEPSESPRVESSGKVRRGDTKPVSELS